MWYYPPGFGCLLCPLQQFAVTCWSTGTSWPHVLGRVSEVVEAKCFPIPFGKETTCNHMHEVRVFRTCN